MAAGNVSGCGERVSLGVCVSEWVPACSYSYLIVLYLTCPSLYNLLVLYTPSLILLLHIPTIRFDPRVLVWKWERVMSVDVASKVDRGACVCVCVMSAFLHEFKSCCCVSSLLRGASFPSYTLFP